MPGSTLVKSAGGSARMASLLAAGTEMLYGLGLGDRVVAISHECDYPVEATSKPRITRSLIDDNASSRVIDDQVRAMAAAGSAMYAIDAARLVELAPDLILTQSQCAVCAVSYDDVIACVQREPALSGTRVVALNPMTLDGVLHDIRAVADAAGAAGAGDTYIDALRCRIDAVRTTTATLAGSDRPRVVCIEWIDPLMLAGNWMPELIELAGGRCDLVAPGAHSPSADWDAVLEFDPDVVVVSPCGFDLARTIDEAAALDSVPAWQRLRDRADRRCYVVDGNAYFNRSGPRIIDSLEILARVLHPDLFGDHLPWLSKETRPWQTL